MIKWLCTLPLLNKIYRQGGIDSFALAHKDIWETMEDEVDKRADVRSGYKISQMMSPVNWDHVISHDQRKGMVFIGGNKADPAFLQSLKSEAELLTSMELWKLLIETPNALAQQVMFKTGEDTQAFQRGRSMIYHLDSQKKIVELLKSYTQPVPPPQGNRGV